LLVPVFPAALFARPLFRCFPQGCPAFSLPSLFFAHSKERDQKKERPGDLPAARHPGRASPGRGFRSGIHLTPRLCSAASNDTQERGIRGCGAVMHFGKGGCSPNRSKPAGGSMTHTKPPCCAKSMAAAHARNNKAMRPDISPVLPKAITMQEKNPGRGDRTGFLNNGMKSAFQVESILNGYRAGMARGRRSWKDRQQGGQDSRGTCGVSFR